MRKIALVISIISVIYNGFEGGLSIGFGGESKSKSLIVFGIQSLIEVVSALLVIYRFRREEDEINVRMERHATLGIGTLFAILTLGTWGVSIAALVIHQEPDSSTPSLIISATALGLMILIWLPKPWIAEELNSSVMRGEAKCSLACIYLTFVLFVGSLIFKFWNGGWWIDSAVAIILGLFFAHQGYEMISWARNSQFDGGCCQSCGPSVALEVNVRRTENRCECCTGKEGLHWRRNLCL